MLYLRCTYVVPIKLHWDELLDTTKSNFVVALSGEDVGLLLIVFWLYLVLNNFAIFMRNRKRNEKFSIYSNLYKFQNSVKASNFHLFFLILRLHDCCVFFCIKFWRCVELWIQGRSNVCYTFVVTKDTILTFIKMWESLTPFYNITFYVKNSLLTKFFFLYIFYDHN